MALVVRPFLAGGALAAVLARTLSSAGCGSGLSASEEGGWSRGPRLVGPPPTSRGRAGQMDMSAWITVWVAEITLVLAW